MKYAFAGAALVAGAIAMPQWGEETHTVEQTVVATITSCGPEVTNCPASSTAWAHPTGGWGSWSSGSWSDSWSTSTPVESSSAVVTSSAVWTTSVSSSAVAVTTPSSSSTWVASSSSPVIPVSSSSVTPVGTAPAPPKTSAPAGPKPSGTAPVSPGGPKASGTGAPKASGTGSFPSSSGVPYTGGAAQNAAGLLAGVGAIAAFFL